MYLMLLGNEIMCFGWFWVRGKGRNAPKKITKNWKPHGRNGACIACYGVLK